MIGNTILGGKPQSTSSNKDFTVSGCKSTYEIENNFFSEKVVVQGDILVVKTIQELRDLSDEYIDKLKDGTYKGVQVLGYYKEGDTPAPIIYYLSDTENEDDGGSVIEVGEVKFEHQFTTYNNTLYFGLSETIPQTPYEKTTIIQKTFDASNKYKVLETVISKGTHVIESPGLFYRVSNSKIIFDGDLKLKDNDSTAVSLTGCRLIAYIGYNIEVVNQKLDGNS